MASLELVLGCDWKENVRYLTELPLRPADAPLNLVEVRDIFDLVVDGTNLTASVDEESIFGLTAHLLESVHRLATGQATKVIIEFPVEPIELVLCGRGKQILLSLYSVDRMRTVIARDVAIDADEFVEVICSVGEDLLGEVFKIDERFSTDPFLRGFGSDLSKLRRLGSIEFAPPLAVPNRRAAGSTSCASGLTLTFELTDTEELARYKGENVFDLHALLVTGSAGAEWDGHEYVLNTRYPVLMVHAVLRRCRELLNLVESGRAGFTCDSDLHHLVFEVQSKPQFWEVTLGNADDTFQFQMAPAACLDAFLTLSELVLLELRRISPTVQVNQRFSDLHTDARDLRGWFEDISETNKYLEKPEEYLQEHAGMHPQHHLPKAATFAWPFESVKALYPTFRWTYQIPRVHFAAVCQTERQVLVPTSEVLVGLDAETGKEAWVAKERGGIPLASYAVAGGYLFLANEGGDVWLSRDEDASDIGQIEGFNGSLLLNAACYEESNVGVLAGFHGQIAGFDLADGSSIWEHTTGHGYLTGVVFDGPIICALSSPGFVQGFAPLTGEMLWKVKLGGVAEAGPFSHQGRVFAITHDPMTRNIAIHAIQPFTGRGAWHLRVEGNLAGPPNFLGDWVVLPVERHGRIQLLGINIEAPEPSIQWTIELMSAGLDNPTPVAGFQWEGDDHGVVRTDRGELTCFKLSDGEIRWRIRPEGTGSLLFRNLELVVIRDSLLSVGETIELRSMDDGRLLHEFGDVLEAPEYLGASGNLSLICGEPGRGDALDQLVCLSLGHYLAVVADD